MSANRSGEFFSGRTSRLARKLNQQVSRVRNLTAAFPTDVLTTEDVEVEFFEHVGFPEEADSLAYEPVQRLLAVGMSDGRVKLIGARGVEATMRAPSETNAATIFLGFLRYRGALLRVSADGAVHLFSLPGRRLLASVQVEGDSINAVSLIPGGPYVLLGCESGDCRVISVTNRGGEAATDTEPAASLQLQPYKILGEDLDGSGGVVALAVARNGDHPLALIVHRNSGALVWDIRAERVLCSAPDEEDDPSKPCSACWVGDHANCFAVGYDDGSVVVWGIPPMVLRSAVLASQDAVVVGSLRASPDGCVAAPVTSLAYLPGGPGTPGGEDCLLVCGGQPLSDPEMLTLLPLELESEQVPRPVPWFGAIKAHVMMQRAGTSGTKRAPSSRYLDDRGTACAEKVSGVGSLMVLTEGGQLVVHDLAEWQPNPLTMPAQELPPMTVSRFVPALSAMQASQLQATSVQHALTLDKLCAVMGRTGASATATVDQFVADWPFSAGRPAVIKTSYVTVGGCHPSALLVTGHRDGRVRVWNSVPSVPVLLTTVPSADASSGERLRAVCSIQVCPASGLLAVGHAGGDVRVYQFSDRPQAVRRASLDESLVPYDALMVQPAGFQYVLRYDGTHVSDAVALALDSKQGVLVVGDAAGSLSAVDLASPLRAWMGTPASSPGTGIARIAIGGSPDGPCVFVAGTDCSLFVLSLSTGEVLSAVKPKHPSRPLDVCLLDCHGVPLPTCMGPLVLSWADNNNISALKSLRQPPSSSTGAGHHNQLGGVYDAKTTTMSAPINASSSPPVTRTLDVQELPSDESEEDLDAALSAAAEAVQQTQDEDRSTRSGRFSIFGKIRSSSPDKRATSSTPGGCSQNASARVTPRPAPQRGSLESGNTVPRPASRNADDEAIDVTPAALVAPEGETEPLYDIDTTAQLWDDAVIDGARRGFRTSVDGPAPSLPAVDYPHLHAAFGGSNQEEDGGDVATYVALATTSCLRVYSVDCLRQGDRSTDRKVRIDPPAAFASAFLAVAGPGIVSLSAQGRLAVHSLPGLAPLVTAPLEDPSALGFPWQTTPISEAGSVSGATNSIAMSPSCCSMDGQVLLIGPGNEMVRLCVVKDCAAPVPPTSTYDWHLEKASREAAHADKAARDDDNVASPAHTTSGLTVQIPLPANGGGGGLQTPPSASGVTRQGSSFLSQVRDTATGLVGGATSVTGAVLQDIHGRVRSVGGSLPPRELPKLRTLFDTPVTSLEGEDAMLQFQSEGSQGTESPSVAMTERARGLASAALQQGAKITSILGRKSSDEAAALAAAREASRNRRVEATAKDRRQLLGAAQGSKGRVHRRTASEVRRVYGHTRAEDARATMERNRVMLAERGEKLKNLEERSAAMAGDAEGFADMARQLQESMSNRKWWQL